MRIVRVQRGRRPRDLVGARRRTAAVTLGSDTAAGYPGPL